MKTNKNKKGYGADPIINILHKDRHGLRHFPTNYFDYFIDIGAHIGVFSLVAKILHPESKIIAVEPCKETCSYLQENLNLLDIKIENVALGNGEDLCFHEMNNLEASYFTEEEENTGDYSVPSIKLKDLLDKYDIKKTDKYYLKIDCEGGESFLIGDKESEDIFREATKIVLEIHFPNKINKQFNNLPTYEQYAEWVNKFKDTHCIRYMHSRKRRGWGHFMLIHKTKAALEDIQSINKHK